MGLLGLIRLDDKEECLENDTLLRARWIFVDSIAITSLQEDMSRFCFPYQLVSYNLTII